MVELVDDLGRRLLNELRQSLEQQTATSEVLGVISRSPGELEPVFESILANATRLCEANFGIMHLYENGKFRTAARHKSPPAFAQDGAKRPLQPGPLHPLVRMAATKQLLHISDYAEDPAYKQHDPMALRKGGEGLKYTVPMSVMPKLNQINSTIPDPLGRYDAVMAIPDLFTVEPAK